MPDLNNAQATSSREPSVPEKNVYNLPIYGIVIDIQDLF